MVRDHVFRLSLGGQQLQVHTAAIRPNQHRWEVERHSHGNCELHVVLHGCCRVGLGDKERLMQSGDALLILPGQYHCATTLSGDFSHFNLSFSTDETIRLCSQFFHVNETMRRLCVDIQQELENGDAWSRDMLPAYFTQLFILLKRDRSIQMRTTESKEPPTERWRAAVIDEFFETHRDSYGTKENLAAELNLSLRQLDRVLQTQYGMSFREKLIEARMDYAAWLLRTGNLTVAEIQARVGYASATTFFRTFADTYSMTPSQYRMNTKEQESALCADKSGGQGRLHNMEDQ